MGGKCTMTRGIAIQLQLSLFLYTYTYIDVRVCFLVTLLCR